MFLALLNLFRKERKSMMYVLLRSFEDGKLHLEPDILECEVKWALEASLQTKLVEMMEFQLSYFKS